MSSLVSVCIPVYNSEKTIRATLESALKQTYSNIEVIVVDNCSTDNTWHIINSFSDSRVKKFRNDNNIGMLRNWNKCLEYATGVYVHFLCGDDIIVPDCIEKKVFLADTDGAISLVFSASEIINESDKVVLTRKQFSKNCVLDGERLAKKSFYSKNIYGEPSNVLFRRKLLDNVGAFNTNLFYTPDWEMWMRLSVIGKVGYICEPLMKYRISKVNCTSGLSVKKKLQDDKLFMETLRKCGTLNFGLVSSVYHHLIILVRTYARLIFMKVRS
ncbi:MAG: glycosyltransferase [Treponema sp.]|nr:glycosyltransferase [Treponema sp.]